MAEARAEVARMSLEQLLQAATDRFKAELI